MLSVLCPINPCEFFKKVIKRQSQLLQSVKKIKGRQGRPQVKPSCPINSHSNKVCIITGNYQPFVARWYLKYLFNQ
jgi:hypothetical protein